VTETQRPDQAEPVDQPAPADAVAPADVVDRDAAPAGTSHQADRATSPVHDEQPSYETGGLRLALLVGSLALVGVLWGVAAVAIILGVVVMIFLHELGHFATAKWSGMKVTEFFIGFGPRIWSFQRGETTYGVKVVPAGAYVRIIGMNNLDEADPADEPRTYRQQSFPKRLLVVSAGSIMHLIQAFVILVVLLGVVGVPAGTLTAPRAEAWDVSEVVADSAAAQAGFEEGDRIVAVDGRPASSFDGLGDALGPHAVGDELTFTVERDGETLSVPAELGARPEDEAASGEVGTPFLGVGHSGYYPVEDLSIGEAVVQAPGEMASFVGEATGAMVSFFSPSGLSDFADTVGRGAEDAPAGGGSGSAQPAAEDDGNRMISIYGAVRLGTQLSEEGWAPVLLLFFTINIFIAILNMLPLPPLDGGHAAVAIYERVRSRGGRRYHADMAKLLPLTYAVVMCLVLLGVTSLYLDIVNPIDV
jgi:membrane-associated protease RseP (regulator of RpoE activity)